LGWVTLRYVTLVVLLHSQEVWLVRVRVGYVRLGWVVLLYVTLVILVPSQEVVSKLAPESSYPDLVLLSLFRYILGQYLNS